MDPQALGHKALAVNLSDLAAWARARWASRWRWPCRRPTTPGCAAFSQGLLALADAHGCALIGGDTTRGPLNICITVFGEVRAGPGAAARRGATRATTST